MPTLHRAKFAGAFLGNNPHRLSPAGKSGAATQEASLSSLGPLWPALWPAGSDTKAAHLAEATLRSSSSLFPHVAEQPTGAPGLVGRTMPAGCLFCHCVPLGGKELYNQYSQRHQVNAFWRQLAGREGDAPDSGRPVNLSRNQPAEKTICLSSHW